LGHLGSVPLMPYKNTYSVSTQRGDLLRFGSSSFRTAPFVHDEPDIPSCGNLLECWPYIFLPSLEAGQGLFPLMPRHLTNYSVTLIQSSFLYHEPESQPNDAPFVRLPFFFSVFWERMSVLLWRFFSFHASPLTSHQISEFFFPCPNPPPPPHFKDCSFFLWCVH